MRRRRLAGSALGRGARHDRGDQRHRARRGRHRPGVPAVLAAHGFTLDAETGEIDQLAPYVGAFSARTAQIHRNIDRYEAEWRREHPGEEPGPRLREAWDRRAWADARPDKVVPTDGGELVARWNAELRALGYRDPTGPAVLEATQVGWIDRDGAADWVISRLGAKRSAWNTADIRGKVEVLLAQTNLVADPAARIELAEDVTARAAARCVRLLASPDVPEHVRSLTSPHVVRSRRTSSDRLARRADTPARRVRLQGRRSGADRPRPRPPSSAPWPVTASWWSSRARPVQARPPRCGRLRSCWHGRGIGWWW